MKNANHNHHITEVFDDLNPTSTPTYSCYFDGTQAQALTHFRQHRKLKQYFGRSQYRIVMRTNSVVLQESNS